MTGLQQLAVVAVVALAHAAGLWALADTVHRDAPPSAPQLTMVMLLVAPATVAVPARAQPPQPAQPTPPPRAKPPPRAARPPAPKRPARAKPAPAIAPAPTAPAAPVDPAAPLQDRGAEPVVAGSAGAVPPAAARQASAPVPVAQAAAKSEATVAAAVTRRIQRVDYLRRPVLEYPSASRRYGEQGRVVLRVLVGVDGQAEKIELVQATAFERLNEAAIDAAQRALYRPFTEDGVAQPAWALVALSFRLQR